MTVNTDEEIACFKCGSNEFRLTRTTKGQILAECSKCGYHHLMEGVSIFWNSDDEEEGTTEKETSETREIDRQKIPKEAKTKSVEELTNEMIEFIEKESLDGISFYEISRIFWQKKGLDSFMFPDDDPDIELKRLKIENIVKERLNYQGEISPKQLKKEKELLDSLKCKIVDEARKDNKKNLTQTDIELYLLENKKVLPRRLQRMLYSLVNSELKR